MKLTNMIVTTLGLLALIVTNTQAGDRRVGGLIIGGGTGAIVGQAVGRNVESTIVGATIGGVVGLMVGNELQRQHGSVNRQHQVIAHSQRYERRPVHVSRDRYGNFREYRRDRDNCKKIITIEKQHHRIKRVVTTVCSPHNNYRYKNKYPDRYSHRLYR